MRGRIWGSGIARNWKGTRICEGFADWADAEKTAQPGMDVLRKKGQAFGLPLPFVIVLVFFKAHKADWLCGFVFPAINRREVLLGPTR
jgi:hypothetical protein